MDELCQLVDSINKACNIGKGMNDRNRCDSDDDNNNGVERMVYGVVMVVCV
jgi:hypothetical protein